MVALPSATATKETDGRSNRITRTKQLLRTNKPNDGNIKQLSFIADDRIQQQPSIRIVMARAILGGGCFWCVEGAFKQLKGVTSALPAYAGGPNPNPTYKQVCSGNTGHAEVVEVVFDSSQIDYNTILEIFFTVHDPTQLNRQGGDIGTQYRSCIMPVEEGQEEIALEVIKAMQQLYEQQIVTTIEPATNFIIAEEYHHDYYARNPNQGYCTAVVSPKLSKVRSKFSHLYSE